jgi:pimeloyl-ACP methyl ester carboxylesterase
MKLTVDGNEVFAATGGRPFNSVQHSIVFVHGAGMDRTVWALQTRYFAHHGYNVLALDLPGHGRSAGKPLSTIEDMAAWLGRFMDAAGLGEAALAGHSMGALVALAATANLQGRVRALALLGAAPKMAVHPDLLTAAKENRHLAVELVTSWGHGRTGHLGGNRAPGLWLMGGAERVLERSPPGVLHNDLAACDAYTGAMDAAAKISCPCRIVAGDGDLMTPAKAGAKLAAAIAGAEMTLIAGCGHMMMLEKSDETLDALRIVL